MTCLEVVCFGDLARVDGVHTLWHEVLLKVQAKGVLFGTGRPWTSRVERVVVENVLDVGHKLGTAGALRVRVHCDEHPLALAVVALNTNTLDHTPTAQQRHGKDQGHSKTRHN